MNSMKIEIQEVIFLVAAFSVCSKNNVTKTLLHIRGACPKTKLLQTLLTSKCLHLSRTCYRVKVSKYTKRFTVRFIMGPELKIEEWILSSQIKEEADVLFWIPLYDGKQMRKKCYGITQWKLPVASLILESEQSSSR